RPTGCASRRARRCASGASRRATRTGCASCATAPTSSTSSTVTRCRRSPPVSTERGGHRARKRFGQRFLVDPSVVEAIVDAVAPRADDLLVEIGPGLAALTDALLARVPHVHAVEIDRDLAARLRARHEPQRLTLHEADALRFDFGALAAREARRLRIVGNLPYNISSPLLVRLLAFRERVRDQHFMLQREVVERIVAPPSTRDFGRLSVLMQAFYEVERLFDVAPQAFD